ncbi:hypothetical protein [Paenibacillus pinistramenti]|uniref:hypothetical protein n=1 Tax=Paenibacillus pinistramenti TaxID=1768003 RepID=UPI0011092589|nr:hypothetical protein [Paenibacillus pinistramenti]
MISARRPLTEREAKLELILSISRSQNAIARILDSMADVSYYSEDTARSLAEQARQMARYQQAMASMLTGITLHPQYTGIPAAPWINAGVAAIPSQASREDS